MKALDIVVTPKGNVAYITETNDGGKSASIMFINGLNDGTDHNAWWDEEELTVIDSIPRMLAMATAHPGGKGKHDVNIFFNINTIK